MTYRERSMVALLEQARITHDVTAIKSSMEAEGISLAELARTKDIAAAAGVGLNIKIGDCEALTDARLARDYGVAALMAPMIESRFALQKFLDMADAVFPSRADAGPARWINVETGDGCEKIEEILSAPGMERLDAIVIGRTDLSAALGEKDANSSAMLEACRRICRAARDKNVNCLIGGRVTEESALFLHALGNLICGFETRKIVFGTIPQSETSLREAIRSAERCELLWYLARRESFLALAGEDADRITKLERTN